LQIRNLNYAQTEFGMHNIENIGILKIYDFYYFTHNFKLGA